MFSQIRKYTNKNFIVLFFLSFMISCSNDNNDPISIKEPSIVPSEEIITIPVVVHIVNYDPSPFTITDADVATQIKILNEDYNKQNADWTKTPDEFKGVIASMGIKFKLASVDPEGNPTTGIIRTSGNVTGFDGKDNLPTGEIRPIEERKLFFSNQGGQDIWDRDKYLNIWVADLNNRFDVLALAGYASFPGSDPRIDGIVVGSKAFGTLGKLAEAHKLGRTVTHEIGHWLGLFHLHNGGNTNPPNCNGTDFIDDTPLQSEVYTGRPVHPKQSCGSNDMFMNFMNHVWDESMFMFTNGQRKQARLIFNEGGDRRELYLNNKTD